VRLAGFDEVNSHAHRRIFLVAQGLRRRLVHGDDLARRVHAQPRAVSGAAHRELGLDRVAQADQHHVDVGQPRLELERGRHRYMGAVVASHAIDRNRDQRGYSSRVLTTFLPR
jgi:hypothetical protein